MGDLPQRLSAAAAGVKDIGGHTLRKRDALQHQRNVIRSSGIVPQLHVVHKPPDGGRIDSVFLREMLCEPADRIIYRAVAGAHQVEALKAPQQLSRHGCQSIALQLHQQRLRVGQCLCQIIADAAECVIGITGGGQIRLPVFFNTGAEYHHGLHRLRDLFTQLADPFQHIVALAL